MIGIRLAAASDKGRVRSSNQDVCVDDEALRVALVADGLGGHSRGDIASSVAAEAAFSSLKTADPSDPRAALLDAILHANAAVRAAAAADAAAADMGTTIVLAWWPRDDGTLWHAHVGDSRAYLLRGAILRRLTVDHTIGARAAAAGTAGPTERSARAARALTQALGPSETLAPDVGTEATVAGDRILLCSDGLTDMLADDAIAASLRAAATPAAATADLIRAALAAGGADNITLVVAEVVREES
jgi:protein phosphatase